MPSAEKLYEEWAKRCPREARPRDVEKVLNHYLADWVRKGPAGSHIFIIEHPALALVPAFDGKPNFSIAVKSGRKIKGSYVNHLLKAIKCIYEYEKVPEEKE